MAAELLSARLNQGRKYLRCAFPHEILSPFILPAAFNETAGNGKRIEQRLAGSPFLSYSGLRGF